MTFVAGQKLRASELNDAIVTGVVGRNIRTTDQTGITTTEVRTLSTSANVVNGRSYRVWAQFEAYKSAVDATVVLTQHSLRYTTDNTEPTITSTILHRTIFKHDIMATPDSLHCDALFHSAATGVFRVALTSLIAVGSGTATVAASATVPCILVIEDAGPTVTATGTVY
jgi:hypothetical protein